MGIEGGLGTQKHLGVKVRTWAGSLGAFWSQGVVGGSRARDPPSPSSTGLCVKLLAGSGHRVLLSWGVIVHLTAGAGLIRDVARVAAQKGRDSGRGQEL